MTNIAPPARVIDLLPPPTILNPIPAVVMPPSQSPGSASSFNPGGVSSGGGGGGGSGGGGSGGGGSQEVETDEQVTATPNGLEVGTPIQPAPSTVPTRTLVMVGGGLVVAYLLFGKKKGKR